MQCLATLPGDLLETCAIDASVPLAADLLAALQFGARAPRSADAVGFDAHAGRPRTQKGRVAVRVGNAVDRPLPHAWEERVWKPGDDALGRKGLALFLGIKAIVCGVERSPWRPCATSGAIRWQNVARTNDLASVLTDVGFVVAGPPPLHAVAAVPFA